MLTYSTEDFSFGPKLRNEAEAVFAARKDKPEFIEYEFKDWKGPFRLSFEIICVTLLLER